MAVRKAGDPGDGMVVQWVVCSAIFLTGLVTFIATGCPPFQPFAMIGGALWAVGNLTAIPIINTIGLGMGILIWGVVNCVVGWATGRFGLFGVRASAPSSPNINYAGLILVIVGGVLFSFVRPKTGNGNGGRQEEPPSAETGRIVEGNAAEGEIATREERTGLVEGEAETVGIGGEGEVERTSEEYPLETHNRGRRNSRQSELRKRIIAVVLSIFAGACYGSTFTPVVYIQDNPDKFVHPSKDAIDYVFSHFSGIILTSTAVLLVYIAYKGNNPYLDNRVILPSFFAGVLWAVAMLCWFVANDLLSQAITFPINAMTPGVIASVWSVLYFKEVDLKYLKLLIAAISVTVLGVTLVGLSKAI